MDDRSFDRLARAVSDLGGGATRRGALRALLGGALAIPALAADAAEAKKRKSRKNRNKWWNGKKCRDYGQACNSNKQCCTGDCWYGICRTGQPGKSCGLQTCLPGYECCKDAFGGKMCTLPGFGVCCNNGSNWNGNYKCCNGGEACPAGSSCCGSGGCCLNGMSCCGGMCCPTGSGMRCKNGQCLPRSNVRISADVGPVAPFVPDAGDSIALAPGEGEA